MLETEKNTDCKRKPLILFSPLDWGLGHTTRCIPLIKAFQKRGFHIVVACNSTQKNLLQAEIYGLQFINLEGYNVHYGTGSILTRLKIISQIGNILIRIKQENRWLSNFLLKNKVDAVLSDNRYGFFHPFVPSIFLTHQLQPNTGFGKLLNRFVQRFLYTYINRFSVCWVPDSENLQFSLAGKLSHPSNSPAIPVTYIGNLSRFADPPAGDTSFRYELLVVLSGPEPQRSIFERLVFADLNNSESRERLNLPATQKKIIIVRGKPGEVSNFPQAPTGVECHNHLDTKTLESVAINSRYVLCRPGYTSLMDMVKLKKKMILVPTPGQGEQEYLAEYFQKNKYAPAILQQQFSLQHALTLAHNFPYVLADVTTNRYEEIVAEFINSLLLNNAPRKV